MQYRTNILYHIYILFSPSCDPFVSPRCHTVARNLKTRERVQSTRTGAIRGRHRRVCGGCASRVEDGVALTMICYLRYTKGQVHKKNVRPNALHRTRQTRDSYYKTKYRPHIQSVCHTDDDMSIRNQLTNTDYFDSLMSGRKPRTLEYTPTTVCPSTSPQRSRSRLTRRTQEYKPTTFNNRLTKQKQQGTQEYTPTPVKLLKQFTKEVNMERNIRVTIRQLTIGEILQRKYSKLKTGDLLISYGRGIYDDSDHFETRIVIQKNPQTEQMIENILDFRDCQH